MNSVNLNQIKMSTKGQYIVDLYPLDKEYVGEVTIDEGVHNEATNSLCQTIIIMDRSGSMGNQVSRIINRVLPLFFSKLYYRPANVIQLITFESNSALHTEEVQRFPSLAIQTGGGTIMSPAVDICRHVFDRFDNNKPVRLLTISDGEIQDQQQTKATADELKKFLDSAEFFINSKAVRLFTSSSQPDTTALCSLLQINNATSNTKAHTPSLVDISALETDDSIATKMAALFMCDDFNKTHLMTASEAILSSEPWKELTLHSSKLILLPGKNVFWTKKIPTGGLKIDGINVKIRSKAPLNYGQYEALLAPKSAAIIEKMKVLKVVGSNQSEKALLRMNQHFVEAQKVLLNRTAPDGKQASTSLSNKLKDIVNDKTVTKMNSAEKALYVGQKNM